MCPFAETYPPRGVRGRARNKENCHWRLSGAAQSPYYQTSCASVAKQPHYLNNRLWWLSRRSSCAGPLACALRRHPLAPQALQKSAGKHALSDTIVLAVTNPCEKLASLRSRPFAHPNCLPSSGGSSETDSHSPLPFRFARTRKSRSIGRASWPAPHIASLPS
jgi:hypothetical protein